MNPPSACQFIFSHFADFAAALPATSVVVTPLEPVPFSAELTLLKLEDMVLMFGRSTPLMFTGRLTAGAGRIVLPLEKTEAFWLNSLVVRPGDVAIFKPGVGYDGVWPREASWASLILPAATLEALLKVSPYPPQRRARTHAVFRANSATWAETIYLMATAKQVALEDPQVLTAAEARRGLKADLLDALRELLATTHGSDVVRAETTVVGRQYIVRAVESAIKANPGQIRSAEDLCAAVGVKPSRLRAAIKTSFGMEPESYLRLRRLAMEHTSLGTTDWCSAAPGQVGTAQSFQDVDGVLHEGCEVFGDAEVPVTAFRAK